MKYDLHVHSEYSSDGYMDIDTILSKAQELKIDGIAITDHDKVKGALKSLNMASNYDVEVIPGIEVSSKGGDVLGLWIKENIESRDTKEVVEEIHDKGGLAVAAHPFTKSYLGRKGVGNRVKDLDFDAIEVYNSRNLSKSNKKALKLAKKEGIAMTAGSDAHFIEEIGLCLTSCANNIEKSIQEHKTELIFHEKTKTQALTSILKRGYKKLLRF